ncbi:protein phosphatase 2C 57 isoform X2 [Selaginella moellendorffii]|uniref:protein phosphatase 2C 57 isoform X2 n=1 Tax=Selaginella moellendorffii TaxID=88036 RepID=UPI000D1C83D6|nr:protein phosphatase 2C 57 isoform X2 [Selaginella moellendorffii]|eukprot:XP_024540537.1 protein phosphatase 2C 57 isoform X2 [Selaginella moellendorffii]
MAVAAPLFGKVCPVLGEKAAAIGKSSRLGPVQQQRFTALSSSSSAAEVFDPSGLPPESSLASPSSIRWAQLALQGPRAEMEDDMELEEGRIPEFTFAAVYDGHAGISSVNYLKKELFSECVNALQGGALLQSDNSIDLEAALSQAFVQVDKRLLSWLEQQEESDRESGSTATVMFLGKEKVVVAHVGDSRVVISRGGKAEELTSDHRPYGSSKTALAEGKRVIAAGGWISNGRVCGNLAVSRAFGDISLKSRRKEMLEEGLKKNLWTQKFVSKRDLTGEWLTAAPDVTAATLGQDAEFIILASDGLWDSIKSKDAVAFVREQLKEHGDIQRACESLAAAALAQNGQDNISILIADFGKVARVDGLAQHQDVSAGVKQVLVTSGILLLGVYASHLASLIR